MTYDEKKNIIKEMFSVLDKNLEVTVEFHDLDGQAFISFPREDDDLKYDIDELINFKKLVIENADVGRVSTPYVTQFPILGHFHDADLLIETKRLEYSNAGIKIKIVKNPLLVGIAAVSLGEYSKYCPPCSPYIALQITYTDPELRPEVEEELKLAKSFIFEQSYLANLSIPFSEISDLYSGWDDEEEEEGSSEIITVEELTKYTLGMELFTRALESNNAEIQYLFFYKIIEYYAPIVAKRTANEKITLKLDAIRLKKATNMDIEAVLSIANQYRTSQTDKELAQSVLKATIEVVEVFPKLPENIKKKVSKEVGFAQTNLNHETNPQTKDKIVDAIGRTLYSTRNSIVHAKSNYISDSNECSLEDLPELNKCLKDITYNLINWYDRLPEHFKS